MLYQLSYPVGSEPHILEATPPSGKPSAASRGIPGEPRGFVPIKGTMPSPAPPKPLTAQPLVLQPATPDAPPRVCVVAEIGVNHDGDPGQAGALIQAAAEAGADAVKLQYFHPDRLLSNQAELADYQRGQAESQHTLLRRLALPLDGVTGTRRTR